MGSRKFIKGVPSKLNKVSKRNKLRRLGSKKGGKKLRKSLSRHSLIVSKNTNQVPNVDFRNRLSSNLHDLNLYYGYIKSNSPGRSYKVNLGSQLHSIPLKNKDFTSITRTYSDFNSTELLGRNIPGRKRKKRDFIVLPKFVNNSDQLSRLVRKSYRKRFIN